MSETCGRCGRRLKNPAYIEIGYGRTCAAKLGIVIPKKRKPKNESVEPSGGQAPEGR